MKLTLAGSAYAREIREALNRISGATLGFRANPVGRSLHLAVLPLFAVRWLIPRLPRFLAAHPDITINLAMRLAPFDFRLEAFDAAVHFGPQEWSGAHLDFLMHETVVPLCSSAMKERLCFSCPADLVHAPLLHLVSRPDAWERWFAAMGIDPNEVHGPLFDQFALIAEAARRDLGVALLPEFLAGPEMESGRLVKALNAPLQSSEAYYLAWPHTHEQYEPLELFRVWIGEEMAATAK